MKPQRKYFLPLWILLLTAVRLSAQPGTHDVQSFPAGASQMTVLIDPYWKAGTAEAGVNWDRPAGLVSGSLFYNDDWKNGYIQLANGKAVHDLPLRYNIYTGEIYFKVDSLVRVIDPALPVQEFGFNTAVFRKGFPATGKNTAATFYECVVTGPLSVLKHITKRISDRAVYGKGSEKVVNDTEEWYLYDSAAKQLQSIKPTKKGLIQALPQYADRIRTILSEKGLSLSSDADWVTLFREMKDPAHH